MTTDRQAPPGAVIGALLIVLGLAFLANQWLNTQGVNGWPLFVMVPGGMLLILGLILPNTGMIIGGSVVTSIGLLLAWQSATGRWETWAYAWALIGPTASGVGTVIGGLRTGNRQMVNSGLWLTLIGLALFGGFYLFFEQIIGLSGQPAPLPDWVVPVFFVGIGVLILLRGFFGPPEEQAPSSGDASTGSSDPAQ